MKRPHGARPPPRKRGEFPQETLSGVYTVSFPPKDRGRSPQAINLDGWVLDVTQTRGALADTYFFKHPTASGAEAGLPEGYTHVKRVIKRRTYVTSWSFENCQPRTTTLRNRTKLPPRTKATATAMVPARGAAASSTTAPRASMRVGAESEL